MNYRWSITAHNDFFLVFVFLQDFMDCWDVRKEIVINFHQKVNVWTVLRKPFQRHRVLIRQIVVRIDEISLDNVVVFGIFSVDSLLKWWWGDGAHHEISQRSRIRVGPSFACSHSFLQMRRRRMYHGYEERLRAITTAWRLRYYIFEIVYVQQLFSVRMWILFWLYFPCARRNTGVVEKIISQYHKQVQTKQKQYPHIQIAFLQSLKNERRNGYCKLFEFKNERL